MARYKLCNNNNDKVVLRSTSGYVYIIHSVMLNAVVVPMCVCYGEYMHCIDPFFSHETICKTIWWRHKNMRPQTNFN